MNPGHYEYGNARLKALKSELFRRGDYERMMDLAALPAFFAALTESSYKSDIHHSMVRYPESFVVAGAARYHITRTLQAARCFYQENASRMVNAYLMHWDLLNLKTIFRGVARKIPSEEIQNYLAATAELDESACIELTRQPDVKSVLNLLRMWGLPFAKDLIRNWPLYSESGSTAVLELALERFRYDRIFHQGGTQYSTLLREAIATEIDVANLAALIVLISGERKPFSNELNKLFISGDQLGISQQQLKLIASSKTVEEMVKRLQGTPYSAALQTVLPDYVSSGNVEVFQRALEKLLLRQGERMLSSDALGPGVVVGFERALAAECANLRLIAQGMIAGLNRQEVSNRLLIPFERHQK